MNGAWSLVLAILGGLTGSAIIGDMVSDEIRGRLERLPRGLITIAARRLPKDLRDDLVEEWVAELEVILRKRDSQLLPFTRLLIGVRYSFGLLRSAPSIGRNLTRGLIDSGNTMEPLVGYRGPVACAVAGITYRQLDYWERTGLVRPSMRRTAGSEVRLYSFKDVLVLKVVKRLLDTGVSLANIRAAVGLILTRGVDDLGRVTLLSDGEIVYECTSSEEIVDLLSSGQGVFGIAVSGALRELAGSLAMFPGEPSEPID